MGGGAGEGGAPEHGGLHPSHAGSQVGWWGGVPELKTKRVGLKRQPHQRAKSLFLGTVSVFHSVFPPPPSPPFREGHYEATQLLLDSGAEINVPSGSNDDTPLTLACWKGHENVVQLLVERNSNVNHQTKTGCTPLMEATR